MGNQSRSIAALVLIFGGFLRAEVMPKSSSTGEEVLRLNCGAVGWDFTDPRGNFWLKDEEYSSNFRWGFEKGTPADSENTGVVISPDLTDLTPIYRTSRWGGTSMRYRADLPNGRYQVTLHFAETYWSNVGERVFDVALQGNVVLDHLDVIARAGGRAHPFSQSFPVTVSTETLEVSFPTSYADNPMISGIEINVQSVTDEAVLAFLQRKMFWYFWNEVGAETGLTSDKSPNFSRQDFPTASIATTGFGLSAMTVAADRGWITPAEARQRVHTTLDFFRTMQLDPARSYHGFWFHFVNWNTGQRDYNSEVSTVDSALFILGALQAGEYFRSVDPSIAEKAERMYKDMEWSWFVGRGSDTPFISMGWTPEMAGVAAPDRGSFIRAWWNMYAESVFVDLLALGSPTHPVDPKAWVEMRRHGVPFSGGGIYDYMHLPPLFVHQYHNLYYDFRDKHDGLADYWEAAVLATQRDRAQCAADTRYEPDIWGLTACDTQHKGYQVYGSEPDGSRDGTAAPTGPLASIAMTPAESIASGRKMFFQYKHAIWGRHGFSDSFSTSANERADFALGLDNGPILLAIENYRSDLIRRTFMQSPFARAGLDRAGFVPTGAAPRYYSESEVNGNHARFAFDGIPASRWESISADGQWLAVDYGKPTTFDFVRLMWETAHGKDYRIQTSQDGRAWTTVATVVDGDGGEDLVRFPTTTARFIRMYGDRRGGVDGNVWGFSLFSMDPGFGLPSQAPTALVGSVQNWNTVQWTWRDNSNDETSFQILQAPAAEGPYTVKAILPPGSVIYTETGVRAGEIQYRRVVAVNAAGISSPSAQATILLPPLFTSMGPLAGEGRIRSSMDESGLLHVTFYDRAQRGLHYSTWDGTSWGAVEWVDPSASGYPADDTIHTFLEAQDLALDSTHRPHVVYFSGTVGLRWAVREKNGWRKELIAPVESSVIANLVVDPRGTPHVVWSVPGRKPGLQHAWRTDKGWMTEPVAGGAMANTSHLALDEMGRVSVVYGSNESPHALFYTMRKTTGWTNPEKIDSLEEWRHRVEPTLVIDGAGFPRVMDCLNNRDGRVRYNVRSSNGWTGEYAHYDAPDFNHTGTPSPGFLLDGNGVPQSLYVMHYTYDPHWAKTLYAVRTPEGWVETPIAEDATWAAPAALTMDAQGRAHVLTRSTEGRIRLTRIDTGSPPPLAGGRNSRVQAPTGFSGTGEGGTVTWRWEDNASNELSYRLYGSTSNQGPFVLVGEVPANTVTYAEEGLATGKVYYRYVVAINAGGSVVSGLASVLQQRPAAPSVPKVVGRTNDSLDWAWQDRTDNATGYRVRHSVDNSILADSLPPHTRKWTQSGLGPNAAQQITVEAFNSNGGTVSPPSSLVHTFANPPRKTTMTRSSGGPLLLSWDSNGNPDHTYYRVYLIIPYRPSTYLLVYRGEKLSTPILCLPKNMPTTYVVRAQNGDGFLTAFDDSFSLSMMGGVVRAPSISSVEEEGQSTPLAEPPIRVEWAGSPEEAGIVVLEPLETFPGTPPVRWHLFGSAVNVTAEGVENPSLYVRPQTSPSGESSVIGRWDEASASWVVFDPNSPVAGGIFGVFLTPPPSLGEERIFPNPFRPSRTPTLWIKQVPSGTQVRFFTIAGEKVCDLSPADNDGTTSWDGRNSAGQAVAAGVYIGILESGGQTKTFRLGVE